MSRRRREKDDWTRFTGDLLRCRGCGESRSRHHEIGARASIVGRNPRRLGPPAPAGAQHGAVRPLSHSLAGAGLAAALALSAVEASAGKPVDLRRVRVTDDAVLAPAGPGGAEVKTTLDPHLQRAAEHLLARSGAHEGAVVAADVRTGRILAWASLGDRDYVAEPFAPSASLFKVVTATALLEAHVSPAVRECYDGGEHESAPPTSTGTAPPAPRSARRSATASTWSSPGWPSGTSLPRPCVATPPKRGFSGEVPIDVPVGASVVRIPDDPFGMARASAGFWNGQLSPLGGLFAMTTVANEGERIRLSVLDHGGGVARVSAGRALPAASARELARMLEVTTKRGTAAKAFRRRDGTPYLPGIPVAAKTGTLIGGGRARMYSWFAGYAPSTKPEIAITVMLGNDLHWHTKANVIRARAAGELLRAGRGAEGEGLPRRARREAAVGGELLRIADPRGGGGQARRRNLRKGARRSWVGIA